MKYLIIGLVIFCSILGGIAQIMLKLGMDKFELNLFSMLYNWQLLIGVFLYGLSFILYNFALKHGDLTLLYPLISFSYIFVIILGAIILKEPFTIKKLIGSMLIVLGVFVITT